MNWYGTWMNNRVNPNQLRELEAENLRTHRDLMKFEERVLQLEMRCKEQDRLTLALADLLVDSGVLSREAIDEVLVPRDDTSADS